MPKDPKKNVDRYKIRGGDINEFEYDQNQEAFAEQNAGGAGAKLIPGTPPEKKAAVATRGASAKKLAAQKATKKQAAKKK